MAAIAMLFTFFCAINIAFRSSAFTTRDPDIVGPLDKYTGTYPDIFPSPTTALRKITISAKITTTTTTTTTTTRTMMVVMMMMMTMLMIIMMMMGPKVTHVWKMSPKSKEDRVHQVSLADEMPRWRSDKNTGVLTKCRIAGQLNI